MNKVMNKTISIKAAQTIEAYKGLLKGRLMKEERIVLDTFLGLNINKVIGCVKEAFSYEEIMEHSEAVRKISFELSWVRLPGADSSTRSIRGLALAKQVLSFFEHSDMFTVHVSVPRFHEGKWHTTKDYSLNDNVVEVVADKLFDYVPAKAERRAKRTIYGKGKKNPPEVMKFLEAYHAQELKLVELSLTQFVEFIGVRKDYVADSKSESRAQKLGRMKGYARDVMKAYGKTLHHHVALENRGRIRKVRNLNSLVDWFGEENQNAMWKLATDIALTQEGLDELKWNAVVLVWDKLCPQKKAMKVYEENSEDIIARLTNGKDKTLYTLRLAKLLRAGVDTMTGFLSGIDATNGGQSHMGMSFKSVEFTASSNFGAKYTPQDSHQQITDTFAKLYGFNPGRTPVKKKNQEKEHGSTTKSVTSGLNDVFNLWKYGYQGPKVELSVKQVDTIFAEKLGKCYVNIDAIAQYGVVLAQHGYFQVDFRLPDGFLATHQAYKAGESYTVRVPSPDGQHKESVTVTGAFPIELVNGKIFQEFNNHKARNKVRGLLANITHSIDAYVARVAILRAIAEGFSVFFKHDKFFMHPNYHRRFREIYGQVMVECYDKGIMTDILSQIEHQTSIKAPTLVYGDLKKSQILSKDVSRQPFLMA